MRLILKIVSVIIIATLIVIFNIPSEKVVYAREWTNLDYLNEYASQYSVSSKVLYNVMMCESGGLENPPGHNDGGLAYGIFQYHESTFNMFAKQLGKEMDYHSAKDQIELTAWAFSKGYQSHWTCFTKLYK